MNPCIDCHALMIKEAGKKMVEEGYDFVFTGEVFNERPMSQTKRSLLRVAKLSGYGDFLLRPLSAKLLPETTPEREGLVDRERLLNIEGRSRKRQLALARKYGLKEFPTPAGGCLLTDPNFSRRLKELFTRGKEYSLRDIDLLKVGRHFRLSGIKVVVGRNEQENQLLKSLATESDIVLSAEHVTGPIGLICGNCSNELIELAAGICVRHSDKRNDSDVPALHIISPDHKEIRPRPVSAEALESWRI
jgi:tRNA U34 2-thiouridine synthase MnmA/TrmU